MTNIPRPDRRWAALLLLLAIAHAPAHAQGKKMFKCLIDGRTVYQQTACPVNAIDARQAAASAPSPVAAPSAAASAAPATPAPASTPRP